MDSLEIGRFNRTRPTQDDLTTASYLMAQALLRVTPAGRSIADVSLNELREALNAVLLENESRIRVEGAR